MYEHNSFRFYSYLYPKHRPTLYRSLQLKMVMVYTREYDLKTCGFKNCVSFCRSIILLLVLGFVTNQAIAQSNRNFKAVKGTLANTEVYLENKHFFNNSGLPTVVNLFHVMVDSKGYTWFSSIAGVTRYDGEEFETFKAGDGLPDQATIRSYEDYKGRIWFIPISGKLSYFHNGKIHVYRHNNILSPILNGDRLASIHIDQNDTIHIGTYSRGYFKISPSGELTNLLGTNSGYIGIGALLLEDSIPILFSIEDRSKPKMEAKKVRLFSTALKVLDSFYLYDHPSEIKDYTKTTRLIRLKNDHLLLSHNNIVVQFKQGSKPIKQFFPDNIIAIHQDPYNSIWVSIAGFGLVQFPDGFKASLPKTTFSSKATFSWFASDRELGTWITSLDMGVIYLPTPSMSKYNLTDFLAPDNEEVSYSMVHDSWDNELFILSNDQQIFHSDGSETTVFRMKDFDCPTITSICYNPYNEELLAAGAGFIRRITDRGMKSVVLPGQFSRLGSSFTMLRSPSDSSIWIGMGSRILKYKDSTIQYYSEPLGGGIHQISRSKSGGIWIGATNGLYRLNNEQLHYYGDTDTLLSSSIPRLIEFGESLWMFSRNHYLLRMSQGKKAEEVKVDNIDLSSVSSFFVQDTSLFFVSNSAINRITESRSSSKSPRVEQVILSEFFGGGTTGLMTTWQGLLTFVGGASVWQFNIPPDFKKQPELLVHIDGLKVNNHDTVLQKHYSFSHVQDHITIKFVGISNQSSKKVNFKYRIKGIDPEWIETSNRQVQYTSIPTGTHTFELIAKASHSGWTQQPITLSFTIAPPYWETWWFISLCFIAGIGLIWAAVSYRYRRLQTESALQMALNESQQQALSARMNPHFIFNALNSIKTFVLENDTIKSNDYIARFSKLMRQILDQSQYTLVSLEEELKALDNYVGLELMRGHKQFSYSCEVDQAIDQQKAMVPSLLLQPFVENAIWHGVMPLKRKGHISVSLQLHNDEIMCRIEDNGVGRANREKDVEMHGPAATQISNKRLDLINQRFGTNLRVQIEDLQDGQGHVLGTRVTIPIPIAFQ